jgi:hypothetical protein
MTLSDFVYWEYDTQIILSNKSDLTRVRNTRIGMRVRISSQFAKMLTGQCLVSKKHEKFRSKLLDNAKKIVLL